jgi:hypothetical protein
MNALTAAQHVAEEAAGDVAFCSVTIWSDGTYFLQVHYGNFPSWQVAEDFAEAGNLRLERRSNALYLIGPQGATWIPDPAMQIYRAFNNGARSTFDMALDDLLEVVEVEDMDLQGVGSRPVRPGQPLIAQAMDSFEFRAANDR